MENEQQTFRVINHDFKPSEGQLKQFYRMTDKAVRHFKAGQVGLAVQVLHEANDWMLKQVGTYE